MPQDLKQRAIDYHSLPRPGKIEIVATKPLANQTDLALAYSPGVAAPCELIAEDPSAVSSLTDRGNLVAVITNGTAVLGLGNIGPLAAKPVMEGKAVLFKKFAGIDVFDIEIDENEPDKLVDIIASLEPTFGGINLEDIKSPECFQVEGKLRQRVNIPVFHDDQHGTAIIAAAAMCNALDLIGKKMEDIKLVVSGAGAAAISCLKLLMSLGLQQAHITVVDRQGVIYANRKGHMDPHKKRFARKTDARTLADAMIGADAFLGLSTGNVLKPEMVTTMAKDPIILALANPIPEIMPEVAREARPDSVIATGRSDYPNQVNNVLCFPYIFRGALDVGATTINEEMKIACVHAIARLARVEASDVVLRAYGGQELAFGRDYLIPKPFDPRLILELAPAVAEAAMASGVATRPIDDLKGYRDQLSRFVFQTGLLMKPFFDQARQQAKRLVYADGEEPNVLRAVQSIVDEGLAQPLLIGRPAVIAQRIESLNLRIRCNTDIEIVNPENDERYREFWQDYHQMLHRDGVSRDDARHVLRTNSTVIAAMMVRRGLADAMLCGYTGNFPDHLQNLVDILGLRPGVRRPAAMNVLALKRGCYFLSDTAVNFEPDAEAIADIVLLAAEMVGYFAMTPRIALLSHASFGSSNEASARKMRDALALIRERAPELEVDGEMQADAALLPAVRDRLIADSPLHGEANLLIMPSLDAARIALDLLTVLGEGVSVGPITLGLNYPAHVLTPSATVRRIINMSTLASAEAQKVKV
jgi:malate dehydrogenase (oxaloacetate-decarboxylating)(NADP+)